ncbi:MAG: DUF1559 domain-containing protein [Planctomycetaceae bacterium]|nr:DUF1559 domain-containing protein [Planctomycetaceae bacterium]
MKNNPGICVWNLLKNNFNFKSINNEMQCSNQLKQLSLALHTYHDAYNAFPAGNSRFCRPGAPATNWNGYTPFLSLMPFYEQQALYDDSTTSGCTPPPVIHHVAANTVDI